MLEQEISIIRDLSLKYMTEGNAMKEKAKESEQKEREMKEETIKLQQRLEEDKRKAVQAVREETEALVARYEREKVMMAEELRLNEAIRR